MYNSFFLHRLIERGTNISTEIYVKRFETTRKPPPNKNESTINNVKTIKISDFNFRLLEYEMLETWRLDIIKLLNKVS